MAKIIVLNGPAGCGKDTLAEIMNDLMRGRMTVMAFKEPLYKLAQAFLGDTRYYRFRQLYGCRSTKEKPQAFLDGMSPRQFLIYLSEKCVKPVLGESWFGHLFSELAEEADGVICTDCGFSAEVLALLDKHEVTLVRLHRKGFKFYGDSRNYVRLPGSIGVNGYKEVDFVLNDGTPHQDASRLIRFLGL